MSADAVTGFLYQRSERFFAQAAHGIRELASDELRELGARKTGLTGGGVHFHADLATAVAITYSTRLSARILAPLIVFDCHSDRYLHRTATKMEWERLLDPAMTFAIVANVANSHIRHSLYATQVLKDAIVDRFRERTGTRPSVDRRAPDLTLNLHIADNRATISVDLGGESLHRRGYRTEGGEAPMQETVAAAILRLTGWDGEGPLVDPMCGSGTLLAEALIRGARLPAGMLRKRWGFERLPDFDAEAWRRTRKDAGAAIRHLPAGRLSGSDAAPDILDIARRNLDALPGGKRVTLRRAAFQELEPIANATIVSNPPYGVRLGRPEDAGALMKELGDFLKQRCPGCTAWLYFGERELIKRVGLKPAQKIPLRAGGLDGRLVKYEMW